MTENNFYNQSSEEVILNLKSSIKGLSKNEAEKRLIQNGKNIINNSKKQNGFVRFLKQFTDLMIIILMVASLISIILGIVEKSSNEIIDGVIIFAIVIFNAIFGFIQEDKAEKALQKLKNSTKQKAKVLRSNKLTYIDSEDIVIGDIVVLEPGDIVPADGRIIECFNLSIDEASLTGESVPASKNSGVVEGNVSLGDRENYAFMGCNITSGRGKIIVTGVGVNTEIGKIYSIISEAKSELTPLQKNLKKLGKFLSIIILSVAVVMFICQLLLNPEGKLIEKFLTAVAISVAAIPESLPAVITVIMAIGVTKLASKKSIVKNLHSVETLGSCNVICSDKTGTITQNQMTVTKLYTYNNFVNAEDFSVKNLDTELLLNCMTLCNDSVKSNDKFIGDPTETALCNFSLKYGYDKQELDLKNKRINELSFDSNRKMMSTLNKGYTHNFVFTKGAVDEVIKKCVFYINNGKLEIIDDKFIKKIEKINNEMGSNALRVLGYAYKIVENNDITEDKLIFIGLTGMIDPPRKEALEAVEKCKKAGLKVYMITGDHKNTAYAVAKQVGIAKTEEEIMENSTLEELSAEKLSKSINKYSVFTRVSPENKVKIVEALKLKGKIVAMTGDGVNDAPSIKSANIGLGMGITGTDVTKEVADIIISDDNFSTIVVACEEGRKIYANIVKTIKYLFSANIAEFISVCLMSVIFPKLTYLIPIQILFINLISDSLPAIAMAFEPADKMVMKKPPRNAKKSLFADGVGAEIITFGIIQTILVLSSFLIGIKFYSNIVASTMVFITLNMIQIIFIFNTKNTLGYFRNFFNNKVLIFTTILNILLLMLLLFVPPISAIFGLTKLSLVQYLISFGLAILVAPITEFIKLIFFVKEKRVEKKKNIKIN